MEITDIVEYNEKVLMIYEKMKHLPNWHKISDLHKLLEKEFSEKIDDFPIMYDTFYSQLKKKGSKKYFKLYFDYLYNLEEVRNEIIEPNNNKIKQFILIFFLCIFFVIFNLFINNDDGFKIMKISQTPKVKQCIEKCISVEYDKQHQK